MYLCVYIYIFTTVLAKVFPDIVEPYGHGLTMALFLTRTELEHHIAWSPDAGLKWWLVVVYSYVKSPNGNM